MASGILFPAPDIKMLGLACNRLACTQPKTVHQMSCCNAYPKTIERHVLYFQTLSLHMQTFLEVLLPLACVMHWEAQHWDRERGTGKERNLFIVRKPNSPYYAYLYMLGKTFFQLISCLLKTSDGVKGDGATQGVDGPCSLKADIGWFRSQ